LTPFCRAAAIIASQVDGVDRDLADRFVRIEEGCG
jgi:hypothetical protein